jgi:hypothetical protein
LFRYDNDFGTVDAFLDLERSEGIELFGGVEVAATSAGDDVEAYYKCCVETLAFLSIPSYEGGEEGLSTYSSQRHEPIVRLEILNT